MKNFIITLLLVSFSISNAQLVSDYKFIVVPEKFSGFDENQHQLNRYLALLAGKKNYEVLSQDNNQWPQEALLNPCSVLRSDVLKVKSFLKNKLEITFTDCNNKEIARLEGESVIKEYDKGYQEAMKLAMNNVKVQNARAAPVRQNPEPETAVETSETATYNAQAPAEQNDNSSAYKNGGISLTRSDLKDGSFLLIQESNAQVFAQFYPTSKQGVFRVKVINPQGESYYTVGYTGKDSVSIEMQTGSNDWQSVEFKK